ncbi:unnamed protein product, partial [Rotaria sp. Silwood1]
MANEPSIGICTLTYTNNFCIIGSNDEYVRVWLNNFTQVYIAAKYDQTRVLILIIFGSIGILNLVNKEYMNLIRSYTQFIIDIDYDDTRKQMIRKQQLSEFTAEFQTSVVVTYAPNRQTFAYGFNNGTIKVFKLNTSIISAEIT